jgi:hypothetical protein
MNRCRSLPLAAVVLAGVCAAPTGAGEMTAELDCVAKPRLLDTHFGRYGYAPTRSIKLEGPGVHFLLPADVKDMGQTGLYSYIGLLGDFEVAATFDWIEVAMPKGGYGVSCGIVVDTEGAGGSVALARGFQLGKGKGSGYLITRGKPGEGGIKYDSPELEPTKARSGRLVLRREQAEVICLVGDGDKEPLRELHRYEFTTGPIRKVRLCADTGGSPTAMDVRLGELRIRAEQITGGIPLREVEGGWVWWLTGLAVLVLAAVGYWLWRRRRPIEV